MLSSREPRNHVLPTCMGNDGFQGILLDSRRSVEPHSWGNLGEEAFFSPRKRAERANIQYYCIPTIHMGGVVQRTVQAEASNLPVTGWVESHWFVGSVCRRGVTTSARQHLISAESGHSAVVFHPSHWQHVLVKGWGEGEMRKRENRLIQYCTIRPRNSSFVAEMMHSHNIWRRWLWCYWTTAQFSRTEQIKVWCALTNREYVC